MPASSDLICVKAEGHGVPISAIRSDQAETMIAALPEAQSAFAQAMVFDGRAGQILAIPDADGALAQILFGLGEGADPFAVAALAETLPAGDYRFDPVPEGLDPSLVAYGWGLAGYRFDRFKSAPARRARLVAPPGVDPAEIGRLLDATALARDLINTPAGDLGPVALSQAARDLAKRYGVEAEIIQGEALETGFPMVAAVGRAAEEAPRVAHFEWGPEDAPRLAVIGKGVCFDSGGLDLKPADGMRLMKKDMGGAAQALALARLIMDAGLNVRLHLVLSIVENAIGGNAFRPGDILRSRQGLSVEVDNTDAEGRLILADALSFAAERAPALMLDFATLTGAARVALGAEMTPFFATDDTIADELTAAGVAEQDPVWRLPLYAPYKADLDSAVADMKNMGDRFFAGAIMAALFMQRFVKDRPWVHFDVYSWNRHTRPGRPVGGEMMTVRAVYRVLRDRFGTR